MTLLAGHGWGFADGTGAAAKFGSVGGIAMGPDNALYVADDGKLRRVGLDGAVTTIASGGVMVPGSRVGRNSNVVLGLAVDKERNILVADYGKRKLVKVTPQGTQSTLYEASWPWAPTGVTLLGKDIYLLEWSRTAGALPGPTGPRVVKISPGKRPTVLGTVGLE